GNDPACRGRSIRSASASGGPSGRTSSEDRAHFAGVARRCERQPLARCEVDLEVAFASRKPHPGPAGIALEVVEQPGPGRVDLERVAVGERAWTGDVVGHTLIGLEVRHRGHDVTIDQDPLGAVVRRWKDDRLAGIDLDGLPEIEVTDLARWERQRVADDVWLLL